MGFLPEKLKEIYLYLQLINNSSKLDQEIKITNFQEGHQNDINLMMEKIALEFEEPIFSSQSKKIIELFKLPDTKFWVATNNSNKVIGTIGMVKLQNKNAVLKSMFVDKTYRGQGISNLLLNHLINWASQNSFNEIYLGTMLQFSSGQRFYEKNGFEKCLQKELPADFIVNPLDVIFYTKKLGLQTRNRPEKQL